jgi:hypothetical protein
MADEQMSPALLVRDSESSQSKNNLERTRP